MRAFVIAGVRVGGGILGLCPLPGRFFAYADDLETLRRWAPDLVLSLTEPGEMDRFGAAALAADLEASGIARQHLPIRDFGTPDASFLARWPGVADDIRAILADGGRVLIHCAGGCGRSGMIALRLMIEGGANPEEALVRLRTARPCAVETEAQRLWATSI